MPLSREEARGGALQTLRTAGDRADGRKGAGQPAEERGQRAALAVAGPLFGLAAGQPEERGQRAALAGPLFSLAAEGRFQPLAKSEPSSSPERRRGGKEKHAGRQEKPGKEQEKEKGVQAHGQQQQHQSLAGMAALGSVALYTAARGGISVFHHLRRKFLRQLLFDLCAALNEMELVYWLDFGSLLGIHRDGDLIIADNDVDLAILDPDWPSLLAALRGALPQYSMRIVIPSDDPTTRFIRVYCPLGMADVFGATPANGASETRLLVDCGHGACTEITRAAVLPTEMLTWRGAKISVPRDIPAVLEERYGDWQTPRYMDKGADVVEGQKLYARIFRALSSIGIRI